LISRDPSGNVNNVSSTFLNLAALETSGIDLQVNHSVAIGGGTLRTNAFIGFLSSYDVQNFPGEAMVDEAGTVNGTANRASDNNFHPEMKFTLAPTYDFGDASIGLRWRYTSAVDDLTGKNVDIDAYSLFDLSASYRLSDEFTLKGAINNLADKNPPEYGGTDLTRFGSYDIIGRFFSIGITGSF
jgi:outer membrane receptor protein involved in Fe transport